MTCLTEMIYAEARGESLLGKRAVAHAALNRVKSRRWPNAICSVINQAGQFVRKRGRGAAWAACQAVANNPGPDPTGGATYFATYRAWPRKKFHCKIGNHYFYS